MFTETRERAVRAGDGGMVRTMNVELARLGALETTQAAAMEHAVPEKPRRGRRPKPRCEHGAIADRCAECNELLDVPGAVRA